MCLFQIAILILCFNIIQAKSSTTNDPTAFLAYHDRKLDSVLGDGNCMFRSLAKQLSGDSDKHGQLRNKLCEFISLNGELLKGWLTDGIILEEHSRSICKPNIFGTQLELKAASTMFDIDIYVATNSLLHNGHYIWTKISPINPISSYIFNDREWAGQFNSEKKCWLEICHQNGCHYDSIRPMLLGNRVSMVPPPLKQEESALIPLNLLTD